MSTSSKPKGPFAERNGIWSKQRAAGAEQVISQVKQHGLDVVRVSFPDQHGILRGKTLAANAFCKALSDGCNITSTLLLKDTSHRTVFPIWEKSAGRAWDKLKGAADVVMLPDPETFCLLPWAADCGWIMADLYYRNGAPVEFATRGLLRRALETLTQRGFEFCSGLEIELNIYSLNEPRLSAGDCGQPSAAPEVTPLAHGFQYLTEARYDQLEPVMALIRKTSAALGIPTRSEESEFGPSQFEFTFDACSGIATADNAVLFRSAVKQVCRRHGYLATFMCKPHIENAFASGWHLHQSLVNAADGGNAFLPERETEPLSELGARYAAGLLKYAKESCAFTTPTINGYKRYQPYTLAPDRIQWGKDNRGSMIRVVGGYGDPATRIENRVGEPAANPYLYLTSQIYSGMAGIEERLALPDPVETPYDSNAEALPKTLADAVAELRGGELYRSRLGDDFVDYFVRIKQAEIDRFMSEVTDWEQREYFELL